MIREITKDEYRRRTAGIHGGWFTEMATGFYEIDPEGAPMCSMEQVPALVDFVLKSGMANHMSGWLPRAKLALEKFKPASNPGRG